MTSSADATPLREQVVIWRCPHCRKHYHLRARASRHIIQCYKNPQKKPYEGELYHGRYEDDEDRLPWVPIGEPNEVFIWHNSAWVSLGKHLEWPMIDGRLGWGEDPPTVEHPLTWEAPEERWRVAQECGLTPDEDDVE